MFHSLISVDVKKRYPVSSQNITIRSAQNADQTRWDDFVEGHKIGLAYHFFAWKQAIEDSYQFECPYFLAEEEDRVCGILPTVHVHPPLCEGKLVSLPYCDIGGMLAESPEVAEDLFDFACRYALVHKISNVEMRSSIESNPDSNKFSPQKVRMLLELPDNSEDLFSSFKSKLRSQINKPERDGLFAVVGGAELLNDFYSVFNENMRDLGSPVHSRNWLRSILKYYDERAKCGVVYMPDHTPAAAGIILCHKRVVSIPWASSLRRFNRYNANMTLYWSFIKYAADKGYAFFDFGRSTPGEGTYRFKQQWGAKPHPLNWENWKISKTKSRFLLPGSVSNAGNQIRSMGEAVFQKMPLPAATFIGSRIRKYISL